MKVFCLFYKNRKIKWILTKYETWFDFFLALFMSGYKCPPKVTFPTTSKINWCKTWLALKDDFSRSRLSHLYSLINKAKKKSNQVSYLESIHLIFPVLGNYDDLHKCCWISTNQLTCKRSQYMIETSRLKNAIIFILTILSFVLSRKINSN